MTTLFTRFGMGGGMSVSLLSSPTEKIVHCHSCEGRNLVQSSVLDPRFSAGGGPASGWRGDDKSSKILSQNTAISLGSGFFVPKDTIAGLWKFARSAAKRLGRKRTDPATRTLYESLRTKLNEIWETEQNRYCSLTESDWEMHCLPRTKKMCEAIIETRARELGVEPKDIIVAVPGYRNNHIELLAWLETGAKVYAIEQDAKKCYKIAKGSRLYNRYRSRLKSTQAYRPLPEKVDIAVWTYPFVFDDEVLFQSLLKNNGIFIIQSEFSSIISGFSNASNKWDALFNRHVSKNDFFMPSELLRFYDSKVAIFRSASL